MSRRSRAKSDPIEQAIERAMNPGAFIPDRACFSFVSKLDDVAAEITRLIDSDPARAVALYEAFLAACYLKSEELDDSSGSFGDFVVELYCGWVKARQAGAADPGETTARLLAWIDEDDYGYCYHLEKHLVEVFDPVNLAAFEKQIRTRFDAAASTAPRVDGSLADRPDCERRHFGEILRSLYAARKNIAAFVALAEETGLTIPDCHAIATLLVGRRKHEEALVWVDRGIDLDRKTPHGTSAGYELATLKRELLGKLGRGNEALAEAWAEYRAHPGKYAYDDLMKFVAEGERTEWHEKAIAEAKNADLHSAIELLIATKEMDRLAALVHQASDQALETLSHYTIAPVAKEFEKDRPDLAGRLWRAQGLRIVNARKSNYYDAALRNFESAKRSFERAGLQEEWQRTVNQVRSEHHRKSGFMGGFERLVEGMGPSDEPSFMEQAKARFHNRHRRER
jgi:hypothetical protein